MKGRAGGSLASRIKKLMQADDEVGKIAQATPVLIGVTPSSPMCSCPLLA